MEPLTLIFIGPQGSGKGTQIANLKEKLINLNPDRKIVDIQTGRCFRSMFSKQETFAEKKIAKTLREGVLQPDFLTYVLWGQEMLRDLDPNCHLLIDGFPRTIDQARTLEGAFDFFERNFIQVINLDTPEEVVRERMIERGRSDDTPESIDKRLQLYERDTLPVLDYYRKHKQARVHDIKGDDSIEEVQESISRALNIN